jgi:hypothetical protein
MFRDRKLKLAARDCLCRCGWPRRYTAIIPLASGGIRIYSLCELHAMAFAVRWNVELPRPAAVAAGR